MSGAPCTPAEMIVFVGRESMDGTIFSEVRPYPLPAFQHQPRSVVIDRQKGRGMDQNVITRRARALAVLLGLRFMEDLRWPCAALQKMNCRCPRCQGAPAIDAPEPQPVHLCPNTLQPVVDS